MGVLSQKRPRTQGLGSLAGAGRCGGWVTGWRGLGPGFSATGPGGTPAAAPEQNVLGHVAQHRHKQLR